MRLCLISQSTSSLPFLLPFILILVCVCVCLHIRVYTGALMCMHVLAEARGGIWGPCFTTTYCIEMGSLTEPGAKLVITKPQLSSSLGPACGSQNLTFYLGAGYPLCDPHACSASLLPTEPAPCLACGFAIVPLFSCPPLPCSSLCTVTLYITHCFLVN